MNVPAIEPQLEICDDDSIVKIAIRLCYKGDLFYHKVAMMVESCSLKKLCLKMAKHYQYLAYRFTTLNLNNKPPGQHVAGEQGQLKQVYNADFEEFATLSDEQVIVALCKCENRHLDSLQQSIDKIDGYEIRGLLRETSDYIQDTVNQLNSLAESALKNDYSRPQANV